MVLSVQASPGLGSFGIFRLSAVSTLLPEGRAGALKGRCRKRSGSSEQRGQACPQPVSSCFCQMLVCQTFWGPEPPHGGEEGIRGVAGVKTSQALEGPLRPCLE